MFESLDLPVLFEAEVVVAGGGPAGIAAALAAARLGKRVVLLEQTGSLGGMGTNALVPAVIYQSDGVNWVVGDFCRSIIEECCREMGIDEVNPGWQEVDAEILKRIYDDRLLKAGVKLFYMIRVADVVVRSGKLESLLVATPHGLRKVKGEVFVDATGDAAVAAFAGVPFDCGDAAPRRQARPRDLARASGTGRSAGFGTSFRRRLHLRQRHRQRQPRPHLRREHAGRDRVDQRLYRRAQTRENLP